MSTFEPEFIIILVHGTWGRGFYPTEINPSEGTRWFEPNSNFMAKFLPSLDQIGASFDIRIFPWSGSNSLQSRYAAARALGDFVNKIAEENQNAQLFVIAHSHGGNLALMSRAFVDHPVHRINFITLATPFTEIFATEIRRYGSESKRREVTGGKEQSIALNLLMLCGLSSMPLLYFVNPLIGILGAFIFTVFLLFEIYGLIYRLNTVKNASQLEEWTRIRGRVQKNDRVLVIRSVDDEAALALFAGLIGNRIATFIFDKIAPVLAMTTVLVSGLIWYVGYSIDHTRIPKHNISTGAIVDLVKAEIGIYGYWTLYICSVLPAAAFVALVLAGICKSTFGKELFIRSYNCRISCNSVPDVEAKTEIRTCNKENKGMRHMIYDNEDCPVIIKDWINSCKTTSKI